MEVGKKTYSQISMARGFMKLKSLVGFPLGILKRMEMPRFMKGWKEKQGSQLTFV